MSPNAAPAPPRQPNVIPPAAPPTGRRSRRRTIGVSLAILAVAAIAVLTLTPQSGAAGEPFGHTCVVCGSLGGSDVIANVLLFMPLGFALVLAGLSGRRAALVGGALSVTVELLQYVAVPGRFATLSDVLTNTTGAALAAALMTYRAVWLRPRPRAAAALGAAAAALFVGTLALSAWALGMADDRDPTPPRRDAAPLPTGLGWFSGEVRRATLDGLTVANRGTGPVTIAAPASARAHVAVEAIGFDSRDQLVPLLYAHRPGEAESWLLLGQQYRQLVAEPAFRGRLLRLRRPSIAIRAIGGWQREPDAPFTLSADVSSDRLTITVAQGGIRRAETVRLSPTLGWALLSPFPGMSDPSAPLATVAWLVGLAAPFGYYARWMARGRRWAELAAAAGIGAALVVGLVLVPRVAGFAPTRPWEWVAAIGGTLAGAAMAEAIRRTR